MNVIQANECVHLTSGCLIHATLSLSLSLSVLQMGREDKRKCMSFASELRKLTGRSRSVTMNGPGSGEAAHSKEERSVVPPPDVLD